MKEEPDYIDKLFVDAFEETNEVSSNEGWNALDKKLFLSELKSFNLVNVDRRYWYFSGAGLVFAAMLFIGINQNSHQELMINAIATDEISLVLPDEKLESNNQSTTEISFGERAENPKSDNNGRIFETKQDLCLENQTNERNGNSRDDMREVQITEMSPFIKVSSLKIRPFANRLINNKETIANSTTYAKSFEDEQEAKLAAGQHKEKRSSRFALGLNLGSVWVIENNLQQERIDEPVLFAGLNFRYNTPSFFIETSFDFSYVKSVYRTNYLYDTLLGKMIAPGYDVIEVVNSSGDTVLERQFHTEIISVYDTLSSKDQVGISSRSSVLSIPIHVGTMLYHRGNFYTSIFTGVMTKLYLTKQQSVPQFGFGYREIIDFETSPTNSLAPEFYIQGGLVFGYQVLSRVDLEFKSTYSHLLGVNSNALQNSKSNLQINFGINYRF